MGAGWTRWWGEERYRRECAAAQSESERRRTNSDPVVVSWVRESSGLRIRHRMEYVCDLAADGFLQMPPKQRQ